MNTQKRERESEKEVPLSDINKQLTADKKASKN